MHTKLGCACECYWPKSQPVHTGTESGRNCFRPLIRSNWKVHVSIISSACLHLWAQFWYIFFYYIDGSSENGGRIPSSTKEKKTMPKEFVCNETIDGTKVVISISFSPPFSLFSSLLFSNHSFVIVWRVLMVGLRLDLFRERTMNRALWLSSPFFTCLEKWYV